ncbi:hypothetical protein R5R35_000940 [Gryllus longicercus]|uniref:Delta(24)-sterol reductase n=1 Tax=Gryllus longicercus TaxID=2509291 RepID=A0AAN9VHL3_9ORTH
MASFDSALEHVLVHYRWVFVCFFLLPISLFYEVWLYTRNWIVFQLNSAPRQHDKKVRNVQRQVKQWQDSGRRTKMCTARPGWQTMSFRQPKYKKTMFNVNVNLVDIINVDEEKRTVLVEPLVNMGQLSATLTPLGWTIPVLPEIDDLTVGGMVMGTGIESSSHKYGLFQHICKSYELVLADGSVVTCSKDNNSELFYSIPWSYGSLGFLTAVEIQIIPATKYVKLEYKPVRSLDEAVSVFKEETLKTTQNQFVEGLMFNKEEGVIMTGNMTELHEANKVNEIGMWYKPWFFEHVRSFLKKGKSTEYIPLRDYYHRHTRSIFWEIQDIIPFGNNPIFRFLLGWMMPPKVSLLKLTQTKAIKKLYENNHIIQDMLVPISSMAESIQMFHDAVQVYPLWLCPFKLNNDPGLVHSSNNGDEIYVDIGVYGVPKVPNFHPVNTTRRIEEYVRKVKGFQMLYADTYATREEFEEMFDFSLYKQMRNKLNATEAFPDMYDKVNKHVRE